MTKLIKHKQYIELRCKSNFSFLRGASHAEELVTRAAELGYPAIGIADINTLAGVVRMHVAAKEKGIKLLVGAEIRPQDGPPVCLYAMNRAGYGRLARLITTGRRRQEKGSCRLHVSDVLEHSQDLIAIVCGNNEQVGSYKSAFANRIYLGTSAHLNSNDQRHLAKMNALSRKLHIPLVAVNDVHYHLPERRFLQDVLVCIRETVKLPDAGHLLFPNGERYLKSYDQMYHMFHEYLHALERTGEIVDRCNFSLDELRYEYPPELCPEGTTPIKHLADLTFSGARRIYNGNVPAKVRGIVEHELKIIAQLKYEHYFLTVWDLVKFARERGILCQGRGSAANSAICYCLGITSVDPDRIDVLFERFVSAERNEPPDIDVDFEHQRREEVMQYIYDKYGRERAGIAAAVVTYRPRSAVRDVGKALGLSLDRVDEIARKIDWWKKAGDISEVLVEVGLDPNDHMMRALIKLCTQIMGFPRHLSQHVGGFVITAGPLCEIVPIENAAMPGRTFIEWDKDDIDELGIRKIDCLSLGMLTAIRKSFDLIAGRAEKGLNNSDFARSLIGKDANERLALVPPEDPAVYDMACKADTVGVFQIESRGQMSMLPRLKPRCFYDLVIEVSIVRPGPIQGGMVHPYLRRRAGEEAITFPSEEVRGVLGKTLGVVLFQEQAMRLAVVAAGFTPGEADRLRRSMGAWRKRDTMEEMALKMVKGMREKGYSEKFANQLFCQMYGFGEYGFPESHAASFAILVYASAWLKRYEPAAFTASILNSLPMGFYGPAQLVIDARKHGVNVLEIDINKSEYDCTLEEKKGFPAGKDDPPQDWGKYGPALRLGLRLIKGMPAAAAERIVRAREKGPFKSINDLARRSGTGPGVLARLAAADAFGSLGMERRQALWQVLAMDDGLPLFSGVEDDETPVELPNMSLDEKVGFDYETTGLSLKAHPMSLIRDQLRKQKIMTCAHARNSANRRMVSVAGLVLVRQRPGTARGIVFITLEDETGIANLIVRPKVYEQYRSVARTVAAIIAHGHIERKGDVVHLQTHSLEPVSARLSSWKTKVKNFC